MSADSLHPANVEVVERFLKYRSDGNVDACLSLVSDSSTWHSPVGAPLHGREGFREALQEAYSETRWFTTETLGIRPRDPDVVAKIRNQGERKGETLDSTQLLLFRVAAGLIVDVRIHVDDPAAVAESGPTKNASASARAERPTATEARPCTSIRIRWAGYLVGAGYSA